MAVRVLLLVLAAFTVLYGCGQASSPAEQQERDVGIQEPEASAQPEPTTPSAASAGGTEVGETFAEAELSPVGDSSVSGAAVFREVGSLGVQVELEVSGLPEPGEPYYAQVHEGSCSEAPRGGDQEREDDHGDDHPGHEHGALGPSLALVHPGALLAKVGEYVDHSEFEAPPADELSGNIDAPIGVLSSDDGTAFVSSLLEGVEPEQLTSGSPKYMDLREPSHDLAPENWPALACADLSGGG
jgi:hypothetical protein